MTGRAGERPAPNRRTPTENGSSPRPCRTTKSQNPNNQPATREPDTRPPSPQPPESMDRIGERKPKTNPVRACAGPHPATSHSITTKPQNPNNPPSPQEPDTRHQARYRPNPWTESGIARRNRDQSTPAPTMTHHADRNHTTNPRNTNNPSALQSSTITKPTTQNTRTTDQTGKRKPKTDPVHTRTDHDTHPGNQATPQTRGISTIRRQHEHRTTTTDDGWHCPVSVKQPTQATAASISAARRRIRSLPRHIAVAALRGRSVPPDR